MKRVKSPPHSSKKKRTTLSLPAELLDRAREIARQEHVSVNTVITRAVEKGLEHLPLRRNAEEILESYRRAFQIAGFTEEELLVLDGIILEPVDPDNSDLDEAEIKR